MDGDISDLPHFIEIKKTPQGLSARRRSAFIGTLGAHGRGIGEYHHVKPADVDLWMARSASRSAVAVGISPGARRWSSI